MWQWVLIMNFFDDNKKDSYHDICHNKSLAISFVTDTCRYRLAIANPSMKDV
ncbi:MAG: hypothetical protein IJ439_05735 [Tyzzerella sp.]|nr:hypothetical protein [Tyzzerella sp.]